MCVSTRALYRLLSALWRRSPWLRIRQEGPYASLTLNYSGGQGQITAVKQLSKTAVPGLIVACTGCGRGASHRNDYREGKASGACKARVNCGTCVYPRLTPHRQACCICLTPAAPSPSSTRREPPTCSNFAVPCVPSPGAATVQVRPKKLKRIKPLRALI